MYVSTDTLNKIELNFIYLYTKTCKYTTGYTYHNYVNK